MPRIRIWEYSPGSLSGLAVGSVLSSTPTRKPAPPSSDASAPVEPNCASEPAPLAVFSLSSLTTTDAPGLGIVSPSARTVPGSAAWIVSETVGLGGSEYVALGVGTGPL